MTATLDLARAGRRDMSSRGTLARRWAAFDWCVRVRPSIWLAGAGFNAHADQMARLGPVGDPETLAASWPLLEAAGQAASSTRESAWQAVANARDQSPGRHRDASWAAIAAVAVDAACSIAWRAIHAIAAPDKPIWATSVDQAVAAARYHVRRSLAPVVTAVDDSARVILSPPEDHAAG